MQFLFSDLQRLRIQLWCQRGQMRKKILITFVKNSVQNAKAFFSSWYTWSFSQNLFKATWFCQQIWIVLICFLQFKWEIWKPGDLHSKSWTWQNPNFYTLKPWTHLLYNAQTLKKFWSSILQPSLMIYLLAGLCTLNHFIISSIF